MSRRESEDNGEDGYLDVAAEPDNEVNDGLYEELDNGFDAMFDEPPTAEPSRALENPNYDTLPGTVPAGADRGTVQSNPAYDTTPGAFDLIPNPAYHSPGDGVVDDIYQDTFDLNELDSGGASNPMMEDDTYFDPNANAPSTKYFDPASSGGEYGTLSHFHLYLVSELSRFVSIYR
jgi:hypothetical protein